MATVPNYDFDVEQADIDRKRKIAEAMMAGGLAPMEAPQGWGVKQSPLNIVAKMLQAYAGMKGQEDVKTAQQSLGERYKSEGKAGLQQYLDTSQGKHMPPEAYTSPQGPTQSPVGQGPGYDIPGDPRKAVLEAMMSGHPMVREIGKTGMDALKPVAPKQHVINNRLVESVPGSGKAPTVLQSFEEQWGPVEELGKNADGKPLMGQRNKENGQIKFAPAGTSVTVDTGSKGASKFAEKVSEQRATQLGKSFEKAKDIPQTLATLDEASANLSAGIKSGITGEIALGFAKAGKALGLGEVDPQIANSEAYRSQMANSVLAILKTLRPASDKDVEYANKAAGGSLTLDDATMLRLINSAKAANYNAWLEHETLVNSNRKGSGASEADLDTFRVPLSFTTEEETFDFKNGRFSVKGPAPATPKKGTLPMGTAEQPLSWEEYVRTRKGK